MPKLHKLLCCCIAMFLLYVNKTLAQSMLGYTDPHGDFYIYDTDRTVQLEHHQIQNVQYTANSLAYIDNTGELKYYTNHKHTSLEISNPRFYLNTDKYLYYNIGYNFSVFNGKKKELLGYIQNQPFAFSDSIACMHDYASYLYAYWNDKFVQLEAQPAKYCLAGDNIVAYVDAANMLKVFYDGSTHTIEELPPYSVQCGANTVAYIDNYKYLKFFWKGKMYEAGNYSELVCAEDENSYILDNDTFCNSFLVVSESDIIQLFKTGDDLVAYIDSEQAFHIFYNGESREYYSSVPKQYDIVDNILWWVDDNNFFHVFYNGIDEIIESYTPSKIKADKDVIVYTDNYGKLKAFYKGESIEVSSSIILDFQVNTNLVMYSAVPNKYVFHKLK